MPSLPEGLFLCPACGDIRGRTGDGRRSRCYCEGVACNWCDARFRRPISAHYSPTSGWLWTPYFMFPAGHRCPPGVERGPGRWYRNLPDVDDEQPEDRKHETGLASEPPPTRPSAKPR